MSVFDAYGKYYNLLYQDKDYPGEVKYLGELISEYKPGTTSCLNIGCGTGNHDFLLSEAGYSMVGVDLSDQMIEVANERLKREPRENLNFMQGDIRSLELDAQYDVVFALFHVISYQNSDADVQAAIGTVYRHLKPGGLFIFDTWYGPAVLEQVPEKRSKHMENDEIEVVREANPVLRKNEHIVEVHYDLAITDKITGTVHQVGEQHNMRYLFLPEIEEMLRAHSMELIHSEEFLSKQPLNSSTWSSLFIARKLLR